jgi:hypothetical protein
MGDRKVTVEVTVRLTIRADEGADISEILDEMEYDFTDTTETADIEGTELTNYNILDSK